VKLGFGENRKSLARLLQTSNGNDYGGKIRWGGGGKFPRVNKIMRWPLEKSRLRGVKSKGVWGRGQHTEFTACEAD